MLYNVRRKPFAASNLKRGIVGNRKGTWNWNLTAATGLFGRNFLNI